MHSCARKPLDFSLGELELLEISIAGGGAYHLVAALKRHLVTELMQIFTL